MRFYLTILVLFFNLSYSQNLTGVWEGTYGELSSKKTNFQIQILQTSSSFDALITQNIYGQDDFGSNVVAQGVKKAKAILRDINAFDLNEIQIIEKEQTSCVLSHKKGYCSFADYHFKWYTKGNQEYLSGKVYIKADYDSEYYSENILTLKKVNKLLSTKDFPNSQKRYTALPKLTSAPFFLNFSKPALPLNVGLRNNKILPVAIETRINEKVKTIKVNSKQVEISIYDYGKIDHDIISVYVDKKPVLINEELTRKPLLVNLEMDNYNDSHEVILVAENLGDIPPNTALMKIKAGDKKYEIKITSTEQKNAVIVFKYKE